MATNALYGYLQQKDLLSALVTDSNVPVLNEAIDNYIAGVTAEINAMSSLFATPTTKFKEKFLSMSVARSQPVDEFGKAVPIKPSGSYDVAYPIQGSGLSFGADYVTRAKMTGADVARIISTLTDGDARWMRDHIFGGLMYGTSGGSGWTFDDPINGSLTILGLANGDSQLYVKSGGAIETDTHILAQANAIDGSNNNFTSDADDLREHPENSGEVIAFIPTGLKASVMALTEFVRASDPNVTVGTSNSVLTGDLGVTYPGTLIGYLEDAGVWVVEWKNHPASYYTMIMTGGERPLGFRQDPETSLQGFVRVTDGTDAANYPFYDSQYLRRAGFGARNRVGALVRRVGNGTYAVPTNYGSPMP